MEEKIIKILKKELEKTNKSKDIPVSAVIIKNNKIIAKAHNKKEKNKCAIDHAEMIVIRKASKKLKSWHLDGCTMYVNLEPCNMCKNAILQSRITKVNYYMENIKKETYDSKVDKVFLKVNSIINYEYFVKKIRIFFEKLRNKNL